MIDEQDGIAAAIKANEPNVAWILLPLLMVAMVIFFKKQRRDKKACSFEPILPKAGDLFDAETMDTDQAYLSSKRVVECLSEGEISQQREVIRKARVKTQSEDWFHFKQLTSEIAKVIQSDPQKWLGCNETDWDCTYGTKYAAEMGKHFSNEDIQHFIDKFLEVYPKEEFQYQVHVGDRFHQDFMVCSSGVPQSSTEVVAVIHQGLRKHGGSPIVCAKVEVSQSQPTFQDDKL